MLLHNLSVLGHQLLGLGQADFSAALHMIYLHACLKFTGADTHKGNSVSVGFIHVGLNLEYKGAELIVKRIYLPSVVFLGRGGVVIFRKCSKKVSTPKLVRADPKKAGDSFPVLTFSISNSSLAPSSSSMSSNSWL